jgi:hypothetical protein
VYEKIYLSSTKQRSSKSNIKKYVSVQLIFFLYIFFLSFVLNISFQDPQLFFVVFVFWLMLFVNYKNRYQIIKYTDSWTSTSDLADSIHPRGEISNHCMEVAIEYMRRTNKVEGKIIMHTRCPNSLWKGFLKRKWL